VLSHSRVPQTASARRGGRRDGWPRILWNTATARRGSRISGGHRVLTARKLKKETAICKSLHIARPTPLNGCQRLRPSVRGSRPARHPGGEQVPQSPVLCAYAEGGYDHRASEDDLTHGQRAGISFGRHHWSDLPRGRRPVRVLVRWSSERAAPWSGIPLVVLPRADGMPHAHRGPHNVLIEREDGSRVVRSFRGLRRK
jgi:hypothetical protein